ncbi:MAG: hypothetical protein JWQ87_651 [Candidatus Sulfotelmatobacter sp.]|nr:hypothetical protein [Candidatus Sulfotelmatobacter sp.]
MCAAELFLAVLFHVTPVISCGHLLFAQRTNAAMLLLRNYALQGNL